MRNPRLPKDLVEAHAKAELAQAQSNGRLFTAKELQEVEDRVYAQVNVRLTYGNHVASVGNSKKMNVAGLFYGKDNAYQSQRNNFEKLERESNSGR